MRRNIAMSYGENNGKVYLYTHWGAEDMQDRLADALQAGRGRWNDADYLARIIFTHVTHGVGLNKDTGYGLAPYLMDDEYPTLEVDLIKRTVNGISFEDFMENPQMFAI